jgi:ribosomal protein L11 methyltransferase
MTVFTEISVTTDGEAAEAVAEVLRPFAYQNSVVLEQKGDMNSLDPMAVEPAVSVKIYVPQEKDTAQLRRKIEEILYHMNRLYPLPEPVFTLLKEKDWAHAWKDNYHPFRVGEHIWIRPSWYDEESESDDNQPDPADVILVMDPGMAFGTGTHPTTQACLVALEKYVKPGDLVLDVGTGTGILAIAAAKLGAAAITAVDTDEQAIITTLENARINLAGEKISAWQGDLASVGREQWDVVVVNILAPVIIKLLESGSLLDYVRPDGHLILSGIIDVQRDGVENALNSADGRVVDVLSHRDWITLIAQPGQPTSSV